MLYALDAFRRRRANENLRTRMREQVAELGTPVRHVHRLQRRAERADRRVAQQVLGGIGQLHRNDMAALYAELVQTFGKAQRAVAEFQI